MQEIQQLAMRSVRERREAAANRDLLMLTIGLVVGTLLDAGIRIYG